MNDRDQNPALEAWFAEADADISGQEFTEDVMQQTDRLKRQKIVRRIIMAAAVGLMAIPMQDVGLALTQVLIVTLVELDNKLVAQLLAPINSVGTLLSLVLFGLRLVHKRLFA